MEAPEWLNIQQSFGEDFNEPGNLVISGVPPRDFSGISAPSITSPAITSAQEGRIYTYDFSIDANAPDILLFPLLVEAPEWLNIQQSFGDDFNEPGNQVIAGVPPTPAEPNSAPYFTSTGPSATIVAGASFSYEATGDDTNAVDALVMEAPPLPAWLTFTYNGNWLRTGTLTGTNAPTGSYPVVLTLRDASGATATQSFTLTVE